VNQHAGQVVAREHVASGGRSRSCAARHGRAGYLAAIGSQLPLNIGDSTYVVGGSRRGDEARWSDQVTSTYCTQGARLIREVLRGISPEVLR
jgi:hypothetical protein